MAQVAENPEGARSVSKYDVRIQQAYRPLWALGSKEPVFFDADCCARLSIEIDFFDPEAASEFQARILAMMPKVHG